MGQMTKFRRRLMETDAHQGVIAERLGLKTTSNISLWSSGTRKIPQKYVIQLCEMLKCGPNDILGVVEDEDITFPTTKVNPPRS